MTQTPSTPGHETPIMTVEILSAEQVRIDGATSEIPQGDDPYARIFEAAQNTALEKGTPVTVHGTDHIRGERSTFTVTSDGQTHPLGASEEQAGPPAETPNSPAETPNPPASPTEGLSRIERRRLTEAGHPSFVTPPPEKPAGGMRRLLYTVSGGTINLGPSEKERKHQDLVDRIARPLNGSRNTAVLSLKGGIGKTSTTVGVGMTMAQHRGDIPCAIDANPDSGDLAERALGERRLHANPQRNISDLLDDLDDVDSLTKLQTYLHQAERLHVLAGEQDPVLSDSLTAQEWERIHTEFAKYYPVILTDCGTGVSHNAMKGILKTADNLVIAAGFAVSGAQRARQTLTWLASHGYEDLARNALVVVTDKENVSERVDKSLIRDSLRGMCRGLVVVPFDQSVVDGDQVNLEMLQPNTREAYMQIAAAIVDGYP